MCFSIRNRQLRIVRKSPFSIMRYSRNFNKPSAQRCRCKLAVQRTVLQRFHKWAIIPHTALCWPYLYKNIVIFIYLCTNIVTDLHIVILVIQCKYLRLEHKTVTTIFILQFAAPRAKRSNVFPVANAEVVGLTIPLKRSCQFLIGCLSNKALHLFAVLQAKINRYSLSTVLNPSRPLPALRFCNGNSPGII